MNQEYRLQHGSYYFYEDGVMRFMTDEVALFFDRESGTLYKHGAPKGVDAYAAKMRTVMNSTAAESTLADASASMTAGFTVIQGKFDPDELNRCLRTTGYVKRLYEQLVASFDAANREAVTNSVAPAP